MERFLPIIDGVGLASSEQGNENYKFKNAFDLAAKKGLQCVAHAGTGPYSRGICRTDNLSE